MITPAEFLELLNDKEKSDFKIGTIDPNYSGGKAKIKFDGEDTVSGKEYLSVGYSPKANDRVLLVKISGTYLILGEIGSAGGGGGGETITASDVSLLSTNFIANNVEGGMDELFTNVNNGKGLIATAITDKGGTASGSNTFIQLATAIGNIPTGTDIETIVAGDTIVYSETNIVSTASTTYAKLREAKVLKGGSITANFSMKTNNAYAEFTAAVFINNSRVSQEYSGTGTSTKTYSTDCDVEKNDLIQLWANVSEDKWQTQNTAFSLGILLPDLGIIE